MKYTISIFLFLGSLEVISWIALKTGLRPQHVKIEGLINDHSGIEKAAERQDRIGEISRIFISWSKNHPEIYTPHPEYEELRSEPARYDYVGTKSGKSFFRSYDELAPDINDEFSLYGKNSGKVKYKINYQTDKYGRRLTGFENVPDARMNIIFMGCSYTFGEGVETNDTLPAQVGKILPKARVYNIGVPGSSLPGRLSVLIKSPQLLGAIDPSLPTILIYVFLDDHLRRMAGTSELFRRGDYLFFESPAFSLEGSKLKLEKGFDEDFWNFRWPAFLYSKTKFAEFSHLEVPPISTSQFKLQEELLQRLESEVRKILPMTKETYLATFPGENFYIPKFSSNLQGVTLLDYSGFDFQNIMAGNYYLPADFHPAARTYEFFSMLLANDLKKIHPEL